MGISQRFSELAQLETKEERQAVYKQALKKVYRRPRFWLYMILGTMILPTGAAVIFVWFGRAVPMPPWLKGAIISGIVVGFFAGSWQFVFHNAIQKQIREEMIARGVPVCLGCGYDLRGQVEPRCPECGRPFS